MKRVAILVTATISLLCTCAQPALAATKTWSNGTANGLWDTSSVNWSGSAWVNNDLAVFGATGVGTVTLNENITANTITFNTTGYTVAQDGGNLYALTIGTGGVSIAASVNASLNAKLTGNNAWNATGNGVLTIGGSVANDSTGTITTSLPNHLILAKTGGAAVTAGDLILNNNPVRLADGLDQSVGGTTTFLTSYNSRLHPRGNTYTTRGIISTSSSIGVIENSGVGAGGGGNTGPNDAQNGSGVIKIVTQSGDNFSYAGIIRNNDVASGGTISLVKEGAGTQALSSTLALQYTGSTTINGGTLKIALANTSVGWASAVNIGGTLELNSTGTTNADSTFVNSSALVFTGGGTLAKTGSGYFGLLSTDIKDFAGLVDVQAGILGSNGTNWAAGAGAMDLNVASGATFDIRTSNVKVDGLTGGSTAKITSSHNQAVNLSLGNNNQASATFDGTINNGASAPIAGGANTGVISLTKNGSGTQVLTGVNTYTGGTTISPSGGTLQIGGAGQLNSGNYAGAISIGGGGTFQYSSSAAQTLSGSISGGGALIKDTNTSTLTLSGATSYTGGTTINAGTLKFDLTSRSNNTALNLGAIAVNANTVLDLNTTVAANYGATALTSGGTVFTGSGTIIKTGAGIVDWWSTSAVNTTSVKDFAGLIDIQQGVLANQTTSDWSVSAGNMNMNIASGAYFDLRTASAIINKFTGAGTLGSSFTAGMTLTLGAQDGSSTFDGVIQNTVPLFANAPTVGIIKNGSGTITFTGANTYTGVTTVSNGALQFTRTDAAFTTHATAISVASGGTLVFNRTTNIGSSNGTNYNNVTGAGSIIVTGTNSSSPLLVDGGWTLFNGTTSLTGTIDVQSGILAAQTSANFAATTASLNVASGAQFLAHNASATVGALTGSGTIGTGWATAQTLTVGNGGGSGVFDGVIAGNGVGTSNVNIGAGVLALTKTGSGTQTLTGANTYSGNTTISGGTLKIGNGTNNTATAGTGTLAVGGNTLYFDLNGAATLGNSSVTSSGLIQNNGAGKVTFSNGAVSGTVNGGSAGLVMSNLITSDFNFQGDVTFGSNNAGRTVPASAAGATAHIVNSGSFWWIGATSAANAPNMDFGVNTTLNSGQGAGTIYYNNLSGGSNFTFDGGNGSQNAIVLGTTSMTGTITANRAISFGNGGAGGTFSGGPTPIASTANGPITFNSTTNVTYSGAISGASGSVTKSAANTLVFSGNNTYGGNTNISSGTLQIGNGANNTARAGTGVLAVGGNTLYFNLNGPATLGNSSVTSSGLIQNNGTGKVTFTNDSAIAGTVNGGSAGIVLAAAVSGPTVNIQGDVSGSATGSNKVIQATAPGATWHATANTASWWIGGATSANALNIDTGTFTVSQNAGQTASQYYNVLSGAGNFTYASTGGTGYVLGAGTLGGTATISSGTLQIGDGANATAQVGTGLLAVGGNTLKLNYNGPVTLNNSSVTSSGLIQNIGTGKVTFANGAVSGTVNGGSAGLVMSNLITSDFNFQGDVTFGSNNASRTVPATAPGATAHIVNSGSFWWIGATSAANAPNMDFGANTTLNSGQGAGTIYYNDLSGGSNFTFNGGNSSQNAIVLGTTSMTGTITANRAISFGNGGAGGTFSGGPTPIATTANGPVTFNSTTNTTYSGVLSGAGTVTKLATNTLAFGGSSPNTYTGQTTVSGGILDLNKNAPTGGVNAIAGDGSAATADDVVINGGTLRWQASNQVADTVNISQSSGAFNLNGKSETLNNYTKTGGTFRTGVGGQLTGQGASITYSGAGSNIIDADALVQDAHITVQNGATVDVYSPVESGFGATGGTLQVNASGTGLEMNGSAGNTINLYTAGTAAQAGKLVLKGDVTTAGTGLNLIASVTGAGSAAAPGTVDLDGGARNFAVANTAAGTDLRISASITNGSLTKSGVGILEYSGGAANTYSGLTTVSGGTLLLNKTAGVNALVRHPACLCR